MDLQQINDRLAAALRPPPELTVSEWAAEHRYLSPEASAEPGRWRNERTPHLVAVMDACSPSDRCEEVVFCSSSQSGKTEIANNLAGFIIDQDPGPSLMIQPNAKPMGEAWSKDRLAPMIRDCPTLKAKVTQNRGRESTNTMLHKQFPGGHLTIGGANSPAGLASRPIRYVLFDEIDRYEITKEGHAIPLATKRTQTFWNRKIVKVSSPTYEGMGILAELEDCDTEFHLMLPCQHCGDYQFPRMKHFQWDNSPADAAYGCEHCGALHPLTEEMRLKMRAKWVPIREGQGKKKGFRMNQFGSSLARWQETLDEFLVAKKDPEKLRVFVNTALAEGWEEPGDGFKPEHLLQRMEVYGVEVPDGVRVITAGVDIQEDRIEVYVWGFGAGEESWAIDFQVLPGKTDKPEVWADLDRALQRTYARSDGQQMPISAACVDASFRADFTYQFTTPRSARRIYSIRGQAGEHVTLIGPPTNTKNKRGQTVKYHMVGVDHFKSLLYGRLATTDVGPGFVHLPADPKFGMEFCSQICAERRVTKFLKGFPKKEWEKIRPRNEALDCTVYAMAALKILNPNLLDEPKTPQAKQIYKRARDRAGRERYL